MSKVLNFKKPAKEINFKVFGRSIAENNLEEAAKVLRDMFGCDLEKAVQMTDFFHRGFLSSPSIIMKTMQIRTLVERGSHNDAIVVINEVFGVEGPDALMVLEAMRKQVMP